MFRDFQATSSLEKGRLAETRIRGHQGHALQAAGAQLARPRKTSPRKAKGSGMRLIRVEKQQFTAGMLDAELWEITREEWNRLVLSLIHIYGFIERGVKKEKSPANTHAR